MLVRALADTAPLLALVDQRDQWPAWVQGPFDGVVFTLDSDFRIYRRRGRQKFPLAMPPKR